MYSAWNRVFVNTNDESYEGSYTIYYDVAYDVLEIYLSGSFRVKAIVPPDPDDLTPVIPNDSDSDDSYVPSNEDEGMNGYPYFEGYANSFNLGVQEMYVDNDLRIQFPDAIKFTTNHELFQTI